MGIRLDKYYGRRKFNKAPQVSSFSDAEEMQARFENNRPYIPKRYKEVDSVWRRRRAKVQALAEEYKLRYGMWPTIIHSDGVPGDPSCYDTAMAVADKHGNIIRESDIGMLETDEPGAWDDCGEEY